MGIEGHFLGPTPVSYGYAGIAVALLGRLHPAGIVLAALFFGLLDQGASNVEISRYALPHEVSDIVKGLIVLIILDRHRLPGPPACTTARELLMALDAYTFVLKTVGDQRHPCSSPARWRADGGTRFGVINIGIEGLMLMGAIYAWSALPAVVTGSAWAAIPAAILAGVVLAALFAAAAIWCRADQIVTGAALNILAFGASTTLWHALQKRLVDDAALPKLFDPVVLPGLSKVPLLGPVLFDQYGLFLFRRDARNPAGTDHAHAAGSGGEIARRRARSMRRRRNLRPLVADRPDALRRRVRRPRRRISLHHAATRSR